MRFRWVLPLVLFAGIAPAAIPEKPSVFVESAKSSLLFDSLSYPARVSPKINATVLSDFDGVVEKIHAPLGTDVKRRQKLFSVRNTDPIYQYAPVNVTAPVAGVVSQVEVTQGSRVSRGQKLATITDPSRISIVIEVAGVDIAEVKTPLVGELRVPGQATPIPVKVSGVSPFVDPGTGTATAELAIDDKTLVRLSPGTVGRVNFKVRAHEGIQVPEHAIVYRGKDAFLRVVEQGKIKLAKVNLGALRRGAVEVTSGVAVGNQIVVRSSAFVGEGEEVQVKVMEAEQFE